MAKPRILIVEDEVLIGKYLATLVVEQGYEACGIARTGEEALAAVARTTPDLILLDIVLEGAMNGHQVADRVRSQARIPIVYLTAAADSVALDKAKANDPFGYLVKPFRASEVCAAIEIALHKHRTESALRQSHEQLRALAGRLMAVREEERRRLARELHDDFGQSLTGLRLWLEALRANILKGGKAARQRLAAALDEMSKLILGLADAGTRAITSLRPPILDDLGIASTLEWYAQDFEKRAGVECSLAMPPDGVELDPDRAIAVFRIVQEALTNVARHAQAQHVRVLLEVQNHALALTVTDDGRGIPEEHIASPQSLGLVGMRERALAFGGQLMVTGSKGQGTTIAVRIPLFAPGAGGSQ